MTLRILIADDEAMARRRLVRLLGAMPDVEVVDECSDGSQVLARIGHGDIDLILLDIHMPELSGMDAIALLPDDGPEVIFTTAHDQHALEAFQEGAADYVLKPVEASRLRKALERVLSRRSPRAPAVERLALPTRKGAVLLSPDEVSHATLVGELVELHSRRGVFSTELRLVELEERLPADRFLRVHRKGLVNLDHVLRLESLDSGGYIAHMDGGGAVVVSRAVARRLRRMLGL